MADFFTPFRLAVQHGGKKGLILLDQRRSVDKSPACQKLGLVPPNVLTLTLNTSQAIFTD
jgi:mRNA interferase MazF